MHCSAILPSSCICTHKLAEKHILTKETMERLTHMRTEEAYMAYNLLLLLMVVVVALSFCRAIRLHKIRFVCRFEGAHKSVHITYIRLL
jgi:hypothetical protein